MGLITLGEKQPQKIGYARVSSKQQDLSLQIDALKEAGIIEEHLYIERLSGSLKYAERPQLEACLDSLQNGDTFVVWKFDRLGRSLQDLIAIVQGLRDRGVSFVSLTEKIDTSSSIGWFFFEIIGAFAEFERNMIRERTRAGLEAARKRGIKGGRKDKFSLAQEKVLVNMYEAGARLSELMEHFRVSKTCIYRYLHRNNVVKLKQK